MKTLQKFDMSNKTTLITGGAGLLGREHAQAVMEVGSNVLIADINQDNAQKTAQQLNAKGFQSKAIAVRMDVTDEKNIQQSLNHCIDAFGNLDVLINNAAIDPKVKSDSISNTSRLENFSIDQWETQLGVGLTGAFLCSKVFGSHMAQRQAGVILNIASDLSVIAPDQRLYLQAGLSKDQQAVKPVTYSVIKAGLVGLTKYLATYWNSEGIRVNALSPGGVENDHREEFKQRAGNLIPLGRLANRDEYRSAVQFLCSDASSYLTGQNIVIDGGRSIW